MEYRTSINLPAGSIQFCPSPAYSSLSLLLRLPSFTEPWRFQPSACLSLPPCGYVLFGQPNAILFHSFVVRKALVSFSTVIPHLGVQSRIWCSEQVAGNGVQTLGVNCLSVCLFPTFHTRTIAPSLTFVLKNRFLVLIKIFLSFQTGWKNTKVTSAFLIRLWKSSRALLPRYVTIWPLPTYPLLSVPNCAKVDSHFEVFNSFKSQLCCFLFCFSHFFYITPSLSK